MLLYSEALNEWMTTKPRKTDEGTQHAMRPITLQNRRSAAVTIANVNTKNADIGDTDYKCKNRRSYFSPPANIGMNINMPASIPTNKRHGLMISAGGRVHYSEDIKVSLVLLRVVR